MEELLDKLTRHIQTLLEKQGELREAQQLAQKNSKRLNAREKNLARKKPDCYFAN